MGNLMIESGRFLAPSRYGSFGALPRRYFPLPSYSTTHLDAVHLVEGPPVLLVVFGVPEVPAEVVEDAEVVAREAVRHEVVVQVAVPRDRQRHHAALDRHPVLKGGCDFLECYFDLNNREWHSKTEGIHMGCRQRHLVASSLIQHLNDVARSMPSQATPIYMKLEQH